MEPFEAVVILDLSKDCFWLNRSFASLYTKSHDIMRGAYPLDTQHYMHFTVRIVAHREIVNILSYCILRSTLNVSSYSRT